MAVCRVERTKNYTVMANYHLDDRRLSLKSKGLLSVMLRLPEDWDYTIEGLSAICQEGKAAIRGAVEELEQAGYICRCQTHDADGHFSGNEYVIYELPQEVNPPLSENRTTVPPLCDYPTTGNRTTDTDIKNQVLKEPIPPKAPKGASVREIKSAPEWKPDRFAKFWAYYPRHEAKQAAIRAWEKLRPTDGTVDSMAVALRAMKDTRDWQRGIGIPYAATWINQARWTDPLDAPPPEDDGGGWAEDREVI